MDGGKCNERRSSACEFENDSAARAVSDCRKPPPVDARYGQKDLKRRPTDDEHSRGVVQQRHGPIQHGLRLPEVRAPTVIVHGECDVPVVGKDVGATALIRV